MPYSFTQLLTIDEPHLVERYNRALKAFDLKPVKLDTFRIDMTGFSPEVAQALGNTDYLDHKKVNRRFIILSPEQVTLSVVQESFSNTRDLMLEFFKKNRRVLYALTIKDVVFGEIEDSIYEVDDIDDLLSIEQVEFKIGTHENLTEKTNDLNMMIDRLIKEPDAWRDDDMLHEMVEIVKQTGDIRDNALVPEEVLFRHEAFWANHFGGIYVFNDDGLITVICDPSARGFRKSKPWQVGYLDINDKKQVYEFLETSGRLQPPLGSWIERSKLLDYRKHMAAVWLAEQEGDELPHSLINQTWVRRWARDNSKLVKEDNIIPLIDWATDEADDWKKIQMSNVEDDLKFVLCRAVPEHPDMALTNRLISHYVPFDFITRFEFNRPDFSRDRENWSQGYSDFVAKALENTYLKNKDRVYEELYL
jgi:hypothetical protein